MPLTWTMNHDRKLIVVTATGSLAKPDLASYMAGVMREGGKGYRVLFDLTAAQVELSANDLKGISQEVQSRRGAAASYGAIALVVKSEAEREMAGFFAKRTNGSRLCKLFDTLEKASAWLEQPKE